MGSSLRIVVAAFIVVLVSVNAPVSVTPLGALQVEDGNELPADDAPGLGSIIGSPDAGPDPEDAGDRGGWAQLTLAVVLVGGVGFIMRKIINESRAGRGEV